VSGGPGDGGGAAGGAGEELTREQLVREFGEPGVANPNVVDLIAPEPGGGPVVLVMRDARPWHGQEQLRQLEEKINRYLGYVLDGFLVRQYPDYAERAKAIRLECRDEPSGEAAAFLAEARTVIEAQGLGFEIRVTGAEAD
jgi:hypothetical protein